ncbi:inovirus-type Gp2 protein [Modicisalibacter tunisiensis]|uniref:YagK/YfjJ domain-containing protein n=1 Tax=Modicisalibacter tunisiensis TaxID=390637 RepID=UPI001CCD1603|nr:inovirus-type Gp2 protein [Modicisalibacter tunisiensis]MBZ9539641.1 inovirus-type Gp2 protein [Modicisalibacter tunisiensis]
MAGEGAATGAELYVGHGTVWVNGDNGYIAMQVSGLEAFLGAGLTDSGLNERLRAWYHQLSLPDFTYECQRVHRNSRDNLKRLRNLIQALFERHGCLLVLRVDLGYSQEYGAWIDYETARHHRERLCQQFHTNDLFAHQLGYAWKLEWGMEKGFHYHFVFFFDANRRKEPVTLNERIGELWAQSITGKQGTYRNCNRNAENIY